MAHTDRSLEATEEVHGFALRPWQAKTKGTHFYEEGRLENYYLYLQVAGMKFLVISLEFKPRDGTLEWANKVVTQHPDHRTIVVTHSYLTAQAGRLARAR